MAVIVDPKSKKLIIRFRVSGYSKQFYLSTGLRNNKSNRAIVDSRWELIQREISLNEFDPTLERYRFGVKKVSIQKETKYTLLELWNKFTDWQEQFLEQSTISHNYAFTARVTANLPDTTEAVQIRDYLLKKYSHHISRKIISDLSRCHDWAIKEQLITENPFKNLKLPKQKKSSREEIAAYTLEQRDLIISRFESHHKYSYYSQIIKFLFWTGCRPGEAFALRWSDINQSCTKITISKSYAGRINQTKGTKNGKRRIFPAVPGGKLQKLLLEMRSHQPRPEDLVFTSITGKQLSLKVLEKAWRGYTVAEKYYYPGVVRELADQKLIPYLKLYICRHTFATWAIALGASPDKVAYWLGDDVRTVLAYYCHPEVSKSDCPDF
ncbi:MULTISPECIES: tyrosine-type recombinase/integrase [unclassified Nodularia (in: cyanobacteria)]|uniref:tyrosine-type recombinase/integrase n=1 Tax=unclassified Nodularia (in: cyanobacteria) TaxID=2656917 RepID=UPI00188216B0|nr:MULTISPECIES: tyrosine-type recombinase/integrase [unclassified Nodularia (in: cyanobacteria)]MBE9199071.1 tyrosine-type recombinase/integrase [Nodularia sp. LEGE 06071]MCC2694073.1 tyrosine-type recombinase/integrase [Nodularia sp. LEGE 04288]